MPAVELVRLRTQIRGLIVHFSDPLAFRGALKDFLDTYSNRAYRPGAAVKPQPLLPSYRVAPLILKELELELSRICQERPEQALAVVEILWQDSHLEPRLIAANLLGAVPLDHGAAVIEKIRAWSSPEENFRIMDTLFQGGTTTLRRSGSILPLNLADDWMNRTETGYKSLGLRLLIPVIADTRFENVPPVFRLLGPLVQNLPGELQPDLQAVLETLIRRFPTETAYFLRQGLAISTRENIARMIRRLLPMFAPPQQAALKAALRATNLS